MNPVPGVGPTSKAAATLFTFLHLTHAQFLGPDSGNVGELKYFILSFNSRCNYFLQKPFYNLSSVYSKKQRAPIYIYIFIKSMTHEKAIDSFHISCFSLFIVLAFDYVKLSELYYIYKGFPVVITLKAIPKLSSKIIIINKDNNSPKVDLHS